MPAAIAVVEVLWRADAHEIARPFGRHAMRDLVEHAIGVLDRLADREPTQRVAVEVEAAISARWRSRRSVSMPPCTMPKYAWPSARCCVAAAPRPRGRAGERELVTWRGRRRPAGIDRSTIAIVEPSTRWMCIEIFGREPVLAAVDVRAKRHAVVVDLGGRSESGRLHLGLVDAGEREHLKAARVGEDRPIPRGEAMQPAGGVDRSRGRAAGRGDTCCRG